MNTDGRWTHDLAKLIARYRASVPGLEPAEGRITEAVWNSVLATRLDADGRPSPYGDLAVSRPPWHAPAAMDAVATEIDLVEYSRMVHDARMADGAAIQAFPEPSVVDVLIHHRDTVAVPSKKTFCLLLRRNGKTMADILNADVAGIETYVRRVIAYEENNGPDPGPYPDNSRRGWQVVAPPAPPPPMRKPLLHRLGAELEARMPRAVSINVDLTGRTPHTFVLFLAIVGSSVDRCTVSPVGLPPDPGPGDLARCWPYAALRLVEIVTRAEARSKPRRP